MRGPRICLRCKKRSSLTVSSIGGPSPRRIAGITSAIAQGKVRRIVLVRRPLHLRFGSRQEETTVSRSHIECGPLSLHRHCQTCQGRTSGSNSVGRRLVFRLGHSHREFVRKEVQPDLLSQWVGLATRQCHRGGGSRQLRTYTPGGTVDGRTVRGQFLFRNESPTRTVVWLTQTFR